MEFGAILLALCSLLSITAVAETSQPARKAATTASNTLLAGLWSLTVQPEAITLEDVTKKLGVDPRNYKVEGGPIYYSLSSLNDDQARIVPVRAMTLSAPALIPGVEANQELRIYFNGNVCVSAQSLAPYVDSPLMSEWFPCTDGAACGSWQPYYSVPGRNLGDKRLATASQLRVANECSQGVVVAKTFDKDYWLALCPFSYTKQVRENAISEARTKHPHVFKLVDWDAPLITDIGGPQMSLEFREPPKARRFESIQMEVDRCDLSVVRSWQPTKHSH